MDIRRGRREVRVEKKKEKKKLSLNSKRNQIPKKKWKINLKRKLAENDFSRV